MFFRCTLILPLCLKLGRSSKDPWKCLKWLLGCKCEYCPSDLCINELQYDHRVVLNLITESCIHTLLYDYKYRVAYNAITHLVTRTICRPQLAPWLPHFSRRPNAIVFNWSSYLRTISTHLNQILIGHPDLDLESEIFSRSEILLVIISPL